MLSKLSFEKHHFLVFFFSRPGCNTQTRQQAKCLVGPLNRVNRRSKDSDQQPCRDVVFKSDCFTGILLSAVQHRLLQAVAIYFKHCCLILFASQLLECAIILLQRFNSVDSVILCSDVPVQPLIQTFCLFDPRLSLCVHSMPLVVTPKVHMLFKQAVCCTLLTCRLCLCDLS